MSENGMESDEVEELLKKWDKAEIEKHKLLNVMFVVRELLELVVPPGVAFAAAARVGLVKDYINKHLPENPPGIIFMTSIDTSDDGEHDTPSVDDVPF